MSPECFEDRVEFGGLRVEGIGYLHIYPSI